MKIGAFVALIEGYKEVERSEFTTRVLGEIGVLHISGPRTDLQCSKPVLRQPVGVNS